jgi:predicted TIM-barrel fold metal-dependent hydrolase
MLLRTNKKSEEDDEKAGLPIPTQFISNGEFWPFPQTEKQRAVERLINEMADERARKLGWSRRKFLGSAAGMATALMAINIVSGCGGDCDSSGGFAVDDCATREPAAARERFGAEYFIMDVQTHHADLDGPVGMNPGLQEFFRSFRICQPGVTNPDCTRGDIQELSRANYIKEIFLDSETAIAIMSGIPSPMLSLQLIGNAAMAATRDLGNRLGASERMLTQGMLTPNFPPGNDARTNLEDMAWMKEELGIRALKTYTGAGTGPNFPSGALNVWGPDSPAWWLDDENIAYPMYEEAERLGINVINTHKGLRLGIFDPEHIHPRDVSKAARDWPKMNFVIYHSAGEFLDDLVAIKKNEIPDQNNVYSELGAIFAGAVTNGVEAVAHLLGKLLTSFGPDHIIWGTDSIWYGTPQWQIDALKTFQMPQQFMDEFGYPEITDEIRAKIFGLNAARLYNINVDEVRCTVPSDLLAQAKAVYPDVGQPSLHQYGFKTRRDFFKFAFTGKNPLA